MTQNPTEKTGRENNPMDDDWNKHIPRQTADEQGDNNPMSSDLTKPDGAVERLEAWFSNLEDIYPDDVRAALAALKTQSAEIERLRAALKEIKQYDDGGFCGRIAHCALNERW